MILDNEKQRVILLDLINSTSFPGHSLDIVLALRNSLRTASTYTSPPLSTATCPAQGQDPASLPTLGNNG